MDSFIYSLNATLPVFLVMVLGYFLRKQNIINDNFAEVADKLVFKVALPVYVFYDIAKCNLTEDLSPKFALFCAGSTTLFFLGTWLFAEVFLKDKKEVGSFVQGSCRGSAAVLGIAFAQNIYGEAGMVPAMIVASVPLFNIFSVILLSRSDSRLLDEYAGGVRLEDTGDSMDGKPEQKAKHAKRKQSSIKWGAVLKSIATNPIIIGIVLGIPFAAFGWEFPAIVDKTLTSVGSLSTPLALLSIGASFKGAEALAKVKLTVIASVIKLIILPAVFLPLAVLCGFDGSHLIAIMIMTGAPSTISGYIMAKNMNNDYVLSSSVIMVTTLMSSVTITLTVFILRCLALI